MYDFSYLMRTIVFIPFDQFLKSFHFFFSTTLDILRTILPKVLPEKLPLTIFFVRDFPELPLMFPPYCVQFFIRDLLYHFSGSEKALYLFLSFLFISIFI